MSEVDMTIIDSDVLIIGSGIAGMSAALEVMKNGKQPLLVSKSSIGKASNTYLAGGRFAFATEGFTAQAHMEKTLQAGKGLNETALVRAFVKDAPSMVHELRQMGMRGEFQSRGFYARHNSIVGGKEVASTLARACKKAGVTLLEGLMITDLIADDKGCYGALGFQKEGKVFGLRSGCVLLATGGAGAIYAQNDNAPGLTGDGFALGMRAGLELMDMEFVQFYPLGYVGSKGARSVVPSLLADLGKIMNRLGEDIKEKYRIYDKPIAIVSRDRLAQAFYKEIAQGNGIDNALLLDMRDVEKSQIPFDNKTGELFKRRFHFNVEPIKITPTCHYNMGGLMIDASCRTALPGLLAAGEVVGGIDGANRMGGNALSSALVLGAIAARSGMAYADSNPDRTKFMTVAKDKVRKRFSTTPTAQSRPPDTRSLRKDLGEVLWQKIGIIRSERGLKEGIKRIDKILNELETLQPSHSRDLWRNLECINAALTARAIAVSALARKESRGSHYREDFPNEDKNWVKHISVRIKEGVPNISRILPLVEQ
jgi:succinate dehydrogenase/fumarate reductase flavoprotein subunit